jgi:SAM-dependent methyltransferase
MAGSSIAGKAEGVAMVRNLPEIRSVLDVGCGLGTWAAYLRPAFPKAFYIGMEVWAPYVEMWELWTKYDHVFVADVRTYPWDNPMSWGRGYDEVPVIDLAVFGDVLEHMTRDEAIQVVARTPFRHGLVSTPIVPWPQGPTEGNPYEEHIYCWGFDEFVAAFPVVECAKVGAIGIFRLRKD